MWIRILLLLVLGKMWGFSLDSVQTYVYPENLQEIYIDPQHTISKEKFLSGNHGLKRIHHTQAGDFTNEQDLTATYWIQLELQNSTEAKAWFLEMADPHVGEVELFVLDSLNRIQKHYRSGYLTTYWIRPFQHKNHVFEIYPGNHQRYVLKVKSDIKSSFVVLLKPTSSFLQYSLREYFFLGLYYGVLAIMLLYNLYLFFHLKQLVHLYYVFYVVACILHSTQEDGLGFQFVWPGSAWFNYFVYPLSHIGLLLSFLFYSEVFLQLRKTLPGYFKLALGMTIAYSAYFIWVHYFTDILISISVLYILPFVVLFAAGIRLFMQKKKEARYYLLAYVMVAIGLFIFILRLKGILPSTVYTVYSFNVALMLEVVIMSHALAERMRILTEERQQAQIQTIATLEERDSLQSQLIQQLEEKEELQKKTNEELERKVRSRTRELNELNQELKVANERLAFYTKDLEHMNSELDKNNWELNKEIQNKVVSNIKGNEISFEEFSKVFPHDEACLKFISELKWKEKFQCLKCENNRYNKGEKPYSRKCTRCGYRETATANTLFHATRFELNKAFYLTYLSVVGKDRYTNEEISEILDLRVSTCWQFRKKIKERLRIKGGAHSWEELVLEE